MCSPFSLQAAGVWTWCPSPRWWPARGTWLWLRSSAALWLRFCWRCWFCASSTARGSCWRRSPGVSQDARNLMSCDRFDAVLKAMNFEPPQQVLAFQCMVNKTPVQYVVQLGQLKESLCPPKQLENIKQSHDSLSHRTLTAVCVRLCWY